MSKIAIIIPSRLDAKRLPNKPLELINNKEMILHVYDSAKKANIGEVYVATPDRQIINTVKKHGGIAIETNLKHKTGTDRIFEVFSNTLKKKPEIIINLQGDMPNINYKDIVALSDYMKKNLCDIGTLAGNLKNKEDNENSNVVKVVTNEKINIGNFCKTVDFFRLTSGQVNDKTFHHVGIYAFTNKALIRYVMLERSKLELERNLEQLRALENGMKINVGLINSLPLSVDTQEDLNKIIKLMRK